MKEAASLAAGVASAVGASVCCVLPLVLVSVGLGGAWLAQLRVLEQFYPVFVAVAVGAFGYAFYRLYLRRVPCEAGAACAPEAPRRHQRIAFWTTLAVAKGLILFPLIYPYVAA